VDIKKEYDDSDWIPVAEDSGPVQGSRQHDNEPPGSIKLSEFLR
jgi:hypothetical protein